MKLRCSGCGLPFKWWENWTFVGESAIFRPIAGKFYHKRCLPKMKANHPFADDLNRVGPKKPLGYLPLITMIQRLGMDIHDEIRKLERRGIKTLVLSEQECHVGSGALYAYDVAALGDLLRKNSAILEGTQWITWPDDFVVRVACHNVSEESSPKLYWLIAEAFGDQRARPK